MQGEELEADHDVEILLAGGGEEEEEQGHIMAAGLGEAAVEDHGMGVLLAEEEEEEDSGVAVVLAEAVAGDADDAAQMDAAHAGDGSKRAHDTQELGGLQHQRRQRGRRRKAAGSKGV